MAPREPSWRALLAAVYLLVLMAAAALAFNALAEDQQNWAILLQNLMDLGLSPQLMPIAIICTVSALMTLAIGAGLAALLWHWRRRRLLWLALAPGLVAVWHFSQNLTGGPMVFTIAIAPLIGGVVQCALLLLGLWWGRTAARLIARTLLPPSLAVELIELWPR
jgi:hypothetical protein